MARVKATYAQVRKNEATQIRIVCIEKHTVKFINGHGRPDSRLYMKGYVTARRNVKNLRPSKWRLANP